MSRERGRRCRCAGVALRSERERAAIYRPERGAGEPGSLGNADCARRGRLIRLNGRWGIFVLPGYQWAVALFSCHCVADGGWRMVEEDVEGVGEKLDGNSSEAFG